MTIRYKCEECGSVLNIKDEKAGTTGRCPKCKAEFVVPAPDASGPDDQERPADEAQAAPAAEPAVARKAIAKSRAADDNLSDDEIEKILEASEQKPKYAAPPPSDEYVVAEGVDQPYDDDDVDAALYESPSGSESRLGLPSQGGADIASGPERAAGAGKAPRKKPRRPREAEEEPAPAFSAAGIAEGLMARGDNLVKHDVVERKAGRPFGGVDKGAAEEEGFGLGEIVGYFARYAIPVIVGLALSGSLYYWWYSGWIRGDLPPLAPVSGTVSLDGVPLPHAEVHFHPIQADPKKPNLKLASSVGFTDANGKYSLIYVNNVAGAVVGKHRVQIFATDEQGRQIIPPQYNSRTKLTVDVKTDAKDPIDIEVSAKEKETSGGAGGFNPPSR